MPDRFDEFYAAYPRKVGRIDAEKAYRKAVKIASHEEIMTGLARYPGIKPSYADWAHPATWLNKGRWMDEPDAKPVNGATSYTSEQLAIIAAHVRKPFYQRGRISRELMEQCVAADLLTREEMEAAL